MDEPEREFLAIAGELDLDGLVVVSRGIDRIIQTFGTDVQAQDRARQPEAAAMGLHRQQDPLVLGCFQLALRHRLYLEGEQGDRTLLWSTPRPTTQPRSRCQLARGVNSMRTSCSGSELRPHRQAVATRPSPCSPAPLTGTRSDQ